MILGPERTRQVLKSGTYLIITINTIDAMHSNDAMDAKDAKDTKDGIGALLHSAMCNCEIRIKKHGPSTFGFIRAIKTTSPSFYNR